VPVNSIFKNLGYTLKVADIRLWMGRGLVNELEKDLSKFCRGLEFKLLFGW
jgi:hypothetical protein